MKEKKKEEKKKRKEMKERLFPGRLSGNRSLLSGSLPGNSSLLCGSLLGNSSLFSGSSEMAKLKETEMRRPSQGWCRGYSASLRHSLYSGAVYTASLPVSCWARLAA